MSSLVEETIETDEIHDRLREARHARGLTQEQLKAALCDHGFATTQTSVGEYETGRTKASSPYLSAFCSVLGVDPRWVLWRKNYSMELESPSEAEALLLVMRQLLLPSKPGSSGSVDMMRRMLLNSIK
jgi:transcriptional regulator with XRE-family HTH domain